jgi:hypothetical protein
MNIHSDEPEKTIYSIDELDQMYVRGDAKIKSIVRSADDLARAWFVILDRTYDRVVRGDVLAQTDLMVLEKQISILSDKIREKTDWVLAQNKFPIPLT